MLQMNFIFLFFYVVLNQYYSRYVRNKYVHLFLSSSIKDSPSKCKIFCFLTFLLPHLVWCQWILARDDDMIQQSEMERQYARSHRSAIEHHVTKSEHDDAYEFFNLIIRWHSCTEYTDHIKNQERYVLLSRNLN